MSHPDTSRVSVAGRDTPREPGPPVAHEMRYSPVIVDAGGSPRPAILASCACGGYLLTMTERYYTHEQLTRHTVMHESGSTP